MAEMFEVVDDVPLRPINRASKAGLARKYPVAKMKAGSWFFIADRDVKSVSAYISRITKDLAGKFSARREWARPNQHGKWRQCEPHDENAVEGVGVWRIE